jgi:hypothetical protein
MPQPVAFDRPDNGHTDTTAPAAPGNGWIDAAWATVTDGATLTFAFAAALIAGLGVYLLMRRPSNPSTGKRTDFGKRLMYAPLVLVNLAAIYGQLAFFYQHVAPATWPIPGKIALAIVVALAIESIAVYVGWHAHDALINKLGRTAARLRRASYGIATLVAAINYAHFADFTEATGNKLGLNAASVAFGLLSLISPWLWGLHSRRAKNIQLAKEGVADATGATFSGERIRSFPIRSYLARRWSIDHYVTDPQTAWEGYNAELRQRWAVDNTDQPGWWMRINPTARVRQLTAAVTELRAITARQQAEIDDRDNRIADTTQALIAAHNELADTTSQLDEITAQRAIADSSLRELTGQADADRQALIAQAEKDRADLIAAHRTAEKELTERLTAERDEALAKQEKDLTDHFTALIAASKVAQIADWRINGTKSTSPNGRKQASPKGSPSAGNRPHMTDEEAVQAMLAVHRDPSHEWSSNSVRTLTGAGFGSRIPRLIAAWREAATERAGGDPRGEGTGDDTGEPWAVNQ